LPRILKRAFNDEYSEFPSKSVIDIVPSVYISFDEIEALFTVFIYIFRIPNSRSSEMLSSDSGKLADDSGAETSVLLEHENKQHDKNIKNSSKAYKHILFFIMLMH